MRLTVLGCGDAFASEGRYNTSFLLEEESSKVLLDCGATTLVRLKQFQVDVTAISTVILTHFHGDHYGGVPFLILSRKVEYGSKAPLTLIGPEGLKQKVYELQDALYPGTSRFIEELDVCFLEYRDGAICAHQDMQVYARQVTHAPPSNPHGIRFSWKGKTIAFSGDTEWSDSLTDLAADSDLLIIECNHHLHDSPGHLGYQTIMKQRDNLKTKRLVLTHMGPEMIRQEHLELERLEDGMVLEV